MIEVQESPESEDFQHKKDYFLEITAQGMKGGQRAKCDGCTVIGMRGSNREMPLNDYEIGQDTTEAVDKRHLVIKYLQGKYYIRDLGDGSGTFVKIQ